MSSVVDLTYIAYLCLVAFLFVLAVSSLLWMLHAWSTPEAFASTLFPDVEDEPAHSVSLIVPARHEERVLGRTLQRLAELDHPAFEVVVVIGHDDPGTEAIARSFAERWPDRIRVVIDDHETKNKPKALNVGLAISRSDLIGVFDAEDEVHPLLLRQVDTAFQRTGADVVQAGVQLVDLRTRWYSLRNCLEYLFWYRSRLHAQASFRVTPLGGNTVFFRRALLESVGGWDEACLAEDCELGIRLCALDAKVVLAYDPMLVTREETPATLGAFLRQRTRWNQGFVQVLRKGAWRGLQGRRRRLLALYTLSLPFAQALTAIALPASLATMFDAKLPIGFSMLSLLPALATMVTLGVELAGVRELCRMLYVRPRLADYVETVLTTLPYQWLLAAAATRAVARELSGRRTWEKTSHVGAHRVATDPLTVAGAP